MNLTIVSSYYVTNNANFAIYLESDSALIYPEFISPFTY
jgi:hypothetical protein